MRVFRGEVNDVLDRYYHAAKEERADAIVRITSDCPLIEPEITDTTIRAFLERRPDYASNVLERTYPRGLDTEIMTWDALDRSWQQAKEPYEREHVTPYIYENPGRFTLYSVKGDMDYSDHRWTLDEPEDLVFLRAIYERMEEDSSLFMARRPGFVGAGTWFDRVESSCLPESSASRLMVERISSIDPSSPVLPPSRIAFGGAR